MIFSQFSRARPLLRLSAEVSTLVATSGSDRKTCVGGDPDPFLAARAGALEAGVLETIR